MTIRGVYAITPDHTDDRLLTAQIRAALAGGIRLLQYRNKTAPPTTRHRQATAIALLCHTAGATFIINDDIPLTRATQADGIHLGQQDAPIKQARHRLGRHALIGLTCHADPAAAAAAEQAGAAYAAMGAVHPSSAKPAAPHCPPTAIIAAKKRTRLPIVAIGGITTANAPAILAAGADAIAVITALFGTPAAPHAPARVTAAAAALSALFPHAD